MIFEMEIRHFESDTPMATWRVPHWDVHFGDVIFVNGKNFRIISSESNTEKVIAIVDNCE